MSGASKRPAVRALQRRQQRQCNVKRRMLIGAAVGFAGGIVVVGKAAESNDGHAGTKTRLQAGVYGAALGTFVGLATCFP